MKKALTVPSSVLERVDIMSRWNGPPSSRPKADGPQYTNGAIFHLPATLSAPNFWTYHSLVSPAETPRFTRTKRNTPSTV